MTGAVAQVILRIGITTGQKDTAREERQSCMGTVVHVSRQICRHGRHQCQSLICRQALSQEVSRGLQKERDKSRGNSQLGDTRMHGHGSTFDPPIWPAWLASLPNTVTLAQAISWMTMRIGKKNRSKGWSGREDALKHGHSDTCQTPIVHAWLASLPDTESLAHAIC